MEAWRLFKSRVQPAQNGSQQRINGLFHYSLDRHRIGSCTGCRGKISSQHRSGGFAAHASIAAPGSVAIQQANLAPAPHFIGQFKIRCGYAGGRAISGPSFAAMIRSARIKR